MSKTYRGFITKFLTKKDEWGLALFRNESQDKLQLKIKGNIATMKPHTRYEINGNLEHNEKYGASLEVETFKLATFNQENQSIKYLTSSNFPGVTKIEAQLIFKNLGPNWLEKIQNDYQILKTIENLEPKLISIIQDGIKKDFQKSPIEKKFQEKNLNLHIYQKLKEIIDDENELEALLKNNFLSWSREQNLGKISDLDEIALAFGLQLNDPERLAFWLEHCVKQLLWKSGNTYTDLESVQNDFNHQLNTQSIAVLKTGLLYAKKEKWLYLIDHKIYSEESWIDENDIVKKLNILSCIKNSVPYHDWKTLLNKVEKDVGKIIKMNDFHFDKNQLECLKRLIKNSTLIISGGPGTGKSTLILGLAILYRYLYPNHKINIATPTGRASMRLKTDIPDFNPMTLHRLLEFDENTFHRSESNPLEANFVIIDEMSMVDNHLFASFLRAGGNLKKLVLVGDINQLPPVNYGDIFNDLITSKKFINLYLTANHRQNSGSGIIKLAEAIKNNQLNQLNWRELPQVEIIFEEETDNLITLKLDYSRYYKKEKIDVMAYQIIAPIYKGIVGIDTINQEFQISFNENLKNNSKIYKQNFNNLYTINDKIICNRNFPEYDLANGEIGIINELEFKGQELIGGAADFGGKIVPLNKELFKYLSLCYACSIHKTQGSEYQKVALVLNDAMGPNSFLNKKLIYTAVTRAKSELLIIANRDNFIKLASHEAIPRLSTIPDKIKNQLID